MKKPSPLRTWIQNSLILLLLAALIALPRPISGKMDLNNAIRLEQNHDYAGAASGYLLAGQRLPWDHSLWEKAGDAWMKDARDYTNADLVKDYIQAESAYAQALAHHALSTQGYTNWGDAANKSDKYMEAIDLWKQALQQGGDRAKLLERIAVAYENLWDNADERKTWQEYLAVQPEDAVAQARFAILLAPISPSEALTHLLKAAEIDPHMDTLTLRTALNTALLSNDSAYQYLITGRGLGAIGEWEMAKVAFQNSIQIRPNYGDAWAWLAEARQQLKQDGTAEIEKAVALNPDSAMVEGLYGFYLERQKQPVRALGAFRIAASLEPNDPGWETAVARAYELTDDLVSALSYYEKAMELAPKDPSTWRALALFSLRDQVNLAVVGLPAARRLVELDKDNWQSVDIAGQILFDMDDTIGAEALFLKAAELNNNVPEPALHLGILYLQSGKRQTAYEQLLRASDLDPTGSSGWQARRLLEQYFQ